MTAQETPAWWENGVQQPPETPAPFQFSRQAFDFLAVKAISPERADVGADARPGNHVHFYAILLEHLNDPDVGETFRCARRERQPHQPSTDLPSEPAQVRPE